MRKLSLIEWSSHLTSLRLRHLSKVFQNCGLHLKLAHKNKHDSPISSTQQQSKIMGDHVQGKLPSMRRFVLNTFDIFGHSFCFVFSFQVRNLLCPELLTKYFASGHTKTGGGGRRGGGGNFSSDTKMTFLVSNFLKAPYNITAKMAHFSISWQKTSLKQNCLVRFSIFSL